LGGGKLNSLDLPGMLPYKLRLKIGSTIALLRNLNGTRLVIQKIMDNVFETIILNGKFQDEVVLLPRISMIPSGSPTPFRRL